MGSYTNACECAGIYVHTWLAVPLKLPMPRATDEWLNNWDGPKCDEFWPHCTDTMTGDQKWLVWALERYLNLIEEKDSSV